MPMTRAILFDEHRRLWRIEDARDDMRCGLLLENTATSYFTRGGRHASSNDN